jgi:hypothetical protein
MREKYYGKNGKEEKPNRVSGCAFFCASAVLR